MGHLGWSPTEFWDASVDELLSAYAGYREREDAADYRAGLITEIVAASQGVKKQDGARFVVSDFFPRLRPDNHAASTDELPPELTQAEIEAQIAYLKAASAKEKWSNDPPVAVVVDEKQSGK
jgi:hypothetical protein